MLDLGCAGRFVSDASSELLGSRFIGRPAHQSSRPCHALEYVSISLRA